MSLLIAREKSSHWYLPSGESYYECERADGKGMRAVTIRDARKVGALPSVTNVLSIINKPGLEAWKQEQAIISALTLPRIDGESVDDFARRVVRDMGEQSRMAAEFGSRIHAACEAYATNRTQPDDELKPYLSAWQQWFDNEIVEVIATEQVLVSVDIGFAGKADLIAKIRDLGMTAVVDFKTQNIKDGKPTMYDQWPMQLGAYAMAYAKPIDCGISVVINSAKPGPVFVEKWDLEKHYDAFLNALQLWGHLKNWDR